MIPGDDCVGRFAAGLVGVDPDAPLASRRGAAFRRLMDDEFLPDPLTQEALLTVAGRPVGPILAEAAARAQESAIRAEVERFAADFFAVPVADRASRWQALSRAAARFPGPSERLRHLKLGLGIDRAAIADPSPATKRLADDLLDLFPLRPRERAALARDRQARFRSDPSLTAADRARASNRLMSRHPAVAALSDGYLARLARPGRSARASRFRVRASVVLRAQVGKPSARDAARQSPGIPALVVVVILAGAFRSLWSSKPNPAPIPFPTSGFSAPSAPLKINPRPLSPFAIAMLRQELKGPIRQEIVSAGKAIDEPTLDRIVGALPVATLPNVGGMATIRLSGLWDARVDALFQTRLRTALKDAGLGLDDAKLDEVTRRSLPRPGPPEAP